MKSFLIVVLCCLTLVTVVHAPLQVVGQRFDYVVTILMENNGINASYAYGTDFVLGNPTAPFQNLFYQSHALAEQYSAVAHPSAPNYEALLSGEHNVYATDGKASFQDPSPNLVDRIESARLSWKAFAENSTSSGVCSFRPPRGADHFPFLMFSDMNTTSRCSKMMTATAPSDPEVISMLNQTSGWPNYVWITPNDSDNCHDLGANLATCDNYLATLVPEILSSREFTLNRALLVITYDEGGKTYPSDYVYTVLAGPQANMGYKSAASYSHYSYVRTIEDNWHLQCLANDCSANNLFGLLQDRIGAGGGGSRAIEV